MHVDKGAVAIDAFQPASDFSDQLSPPASDGLR